MYRVYRRTSMKFLRAQEHGTVIPALKAANRSRDPDQGHGVLPNYVGVLLKSFLLALFMP